MGNLRRSELGDALFILFLLLILILTLFDCCASLNDESENRDRALKEFYDNAAEFGFQTAVSGAEKFFELSEMKGVGVKQYWGWYYFPEFEMKDGWKVGIYIVRFLHEVDEKPRWVIFGVNYNPRTEEKRDYYACYFLTDYVETEFLEDVLSIRKTEPEWDMMGFRWREYRLYARLIWLAAKKKAWDPDAGFIKKNN